MRSFLESWTHGRPLGWRGIAGLVLVPIVVASMLGWAVVRLDDRMPTVRAAIVNHDEPVTVEGQVVPMGRQLSAALVEGPADRSGFTWVLSDDDDAASGLDSGRYVARVVIPENFSEAATSYGGNALDAEHATLDVTISPSSPVSDAEVARALADAAARSLNSDLIQGYLDRIYLGFNSSADGMRKLADGTDQLADGAGRLSSGVGQSGNGARQLADGLGQLSRNGPLITGGVSQLADGNRQLADGLAQLGDGLDTMSTGTEQFASGATTYAGGVRTYTDGVHDAANGARQVSDGINALSTQLDESLPSEADVQQIRQIVDELRPVLDQITAALSDLQDEADRLADATGNVSDGLQQTVATLQSARNGNLACPAEIAAGGGNACQIWQEGVSAGAEPALRALTTTDPDTGYSLVTGAAAAARAASDFGAAVEQNGGTLPGFDPAKAKALTASLEDLPGQITQLRDGVGKLAGGAEQVSGGLAQLDANGSAVADGANRLASGADALAAGARGTAQGASQLAGGADRLADGTADLDANLGQYVDGVSRSSDGAGQLSSGLSRLGSGADDLADGTRKLAQQVSDGVGDIPTYDSAERRHLAEVVSSPIDTGNLTDGSVPRTALGSLLLALGVWLGALATYLVARPLSERLLSSSASTPLLILHTLWPGAVMVVAQGLGLGIVGTAVMGLGLLRSLALGGVLAFAGVMCAVVNHALASWAGNWGRVVAGLMAVVTVLGSVTAALPGFFEVAQNLSALTPVVHAVRAVAAGGSPASGLSGITVWLLVGLVASGLAVLRQRGVSVERFLREYAS